MPPSTRTYEEEGRLAQRCRNHDADAQTELWRRCHVCVLHAVRRWLARYRAPRGLDVDVAATFWSDLFYHKPWRLRGFKPERGCLGAYLAGIVRPAVLDFLAAERRQQMATLPLPDLDRPAPRTDETTVHEELEYVLSHSSEADRALLAHLRDDPATPERQPPGPEATRAAACLRQRKKRLIHKVLRLLELQPGKGELGENGEAPSQTDLGIRDIG